MEVGDFGQLLGYPIYPHNLSFHLDHDHMFGGVLHQDGLVRGTPFGGMSFLHVKAVEWGSSPNRGKQINGPKPANNMATNCYERGELFRRFYLQKPPER